MFNVYNVKPSSSVRRQPSATRQTDPAPQMEAVGASSPKPRPPPPQSSTSSAPVAPNGRGSAIAAAASASPTGRGQPRTVPSAAHAAAQRPQAASQPNASSLPPLPQSTRRDGPASDDAANPAGVRSGLPRRVASTDGHATATATASGPPQPQQRHSAPAHRESEPMPSAPSSQLPSHVRRISGDSRSPSGGPANYNPYASTGPAARASVIPPGGASPPPQKGKNASAKKPATPHAAPAAVPAPSQSAVLAAQEKESRLSRAQRLSPQRERGPQPFPDADTTARHERDAGAAAEVSSQPQRSNVAPVPRPIDFYDGTRGFSARPEPLEDLSRVLRGADRRASTSQSADGSAPPKRSRASATRDSGDVVDGSSTPPHKHDVCKSKTGVAGATPWHGREPAAAEDRCQPPAPPAAQQQQQQQQQQQRPPRHGHSGSSASRRPRPPATYSDEVDGVAVSPPRQELSANRFVRYAEKPAHNGSGGPHHGQPPAHVSPVRILPEESPYRSRASQGRTSTSPMRQPSWRGASDSAPRGEQEARRLPRESRGTGTYVDDFPSVGSDTRTPAVPAPHRRQPQQTQQPPPARGPSAGADSDMASVASSNTSSTSARHYRPHAKRPPRQPQHQPSQQQPLALPPPPPSAPPRSVPAVKSATAWTTVVSSANSAPAPPRRGSHNPRLSASAASDLSSLASSVQQMKGQRRPSWRRLAPFFPNVQFEGRTDAEIVRLMEDELRILSSPPKAPPRVSQPQPPPQQQLQRQQQQQQQQPPRDAGESPPPPPSQKHERKPPAAPTALTASAPKKSSIGSSTARVDSVNMARPAMPTQETATAHPDPAADRYDSTSWTPTASGLANSSVKKPHSLVTLHASERASAVEPTPSLTSSATVQTRESQRPLHASEHLSAVAVAGPERTKSVASSAPVMRSAPDTPASSFKASIHRAVEAAEAGSQKDDKAPVVAVKPIAIAGIEHRSASPTTPRLPASGKSSPRYFAPTAGSTKGRQTSSVVTMSSSAGLRASRTVHTREVDQKTHELIVAPPQWMCGDAVEAVLLDAYMQLGDLESQYFRLDMETHEEIEDTVHVVAMNEYDRATGVPRRYIPKGTEQEILPLLRFPEDQIITTYDLSRQGFLNLCAAMWLTRFQSENGIRDLVVEQGWTTTSPSASFSLLRQNYGEVNARSAPGGVIAEDARALNMWIPDFNRATDLLEQLDNLVSWAVRTWVGQQQPTVPSTSGSPLSQTPFDASNFGNNTGDGDSAIALARRKGPPTSTLSSAHHRRTPSLPSDAGLPSSASADARRDPVARYCGRELKDAPLNLSCWPDIIWTTSDSPSLVEHATNFVLTCLAPDYADTRAKAIASAAADKAPAMHDAQKTWSLFLGAAQWNSDDVLPESLATAAMPTKAARIAYSFVARARTYNLTGGVGALFYSFLTNQLPETAFLDSMFQLEKLRLALLYSPLLTRGGDSQFHQPARKTDSGIERGSSSYRAATDYGDDEDYDSTTPTVYDVALSLHHFFPRKTPSALLNVYEALIQDLQYLSKLTQLEMLVAKRVQAGADDVVRGGGSPPPPNADITAELVDSWDELETEDTPNASAKKRDAPPAHSNAAETKNNNNNTSKPPGGGAKSGDDDQKEVQTLGSEAARALLWAAMVYAETQTVLPISRTGTPYDAVLEQFGNGQTFTSPLLTDGDVWELLSTPVPVDVLFKYQMRPTRTVTSPSRGTAAEEQDEVKEASLLYDPPVGCKSRLVETVRLQYVCDLLQHITDMQEAILSAKQYESPGATAYLRQQRAEFKARTRGGADAAAENDAVELGSRNSSNGSETFSIDVSSHADEVTEIGADDNVTSVRAVLVALQLADPCQNEKDVKNYLRHLLVLYYSNHTLDDLFVDEEEPEEVQLARSITADLSLHNWFTPIAQSDGARGAPKAECDRVFVHIQELAGLCPRVIGRRATPLDDPFAVEL